MYLRAQELSEGGALLKYCRFIFRTRVKHTYQPTNLVLALSIKAIRSNSYPIWAVASFFNFNLELESVLGFFPEY